MTHRVAIVAASPAVREALAVALAGDSRWQVVACVAAATELADRSEAFDVILADAATMLEGSSVSQVPSPNEPPGEPLTPRELEVFELVAKGLSNPDIGAALGISAHTAKFHVGQILAKIGAASRAEAVGLGLKLGLIGV